MVSHGNFLRKVIEKLAADHNIEVQIFTGLQKSWLKYHCGIDTDDESGASAEAPSNGPKFDEKKSVLYNLIGNGAIFKVVNGREVHWFIRHFPQRLTSLTKGEELPN